MPFRFRELMPLSDGVPFTGVTAVSENADPGTCDEDHAFSACAPSDFLSSGVELDEGIPCGLVEKDVVYTISGTAFAPGATAVTIDQLHVESDTWFHTCLDVEASGRFEGDISWDSTIFPHRGYLMVAAANDNCEPLQPWDISMRIVLAEPDGF
jgi:hypothetical protein